MNKLTLTILSFVGLVGSSFAGGSSYGKSVSKAPVEPAPALPSGCNCFAAGSQGLSLYAANFSGADEFEDSLGAGLSYSTWATENVGFELDATWAFTDSTVHTINGSVVLRAPITSICLAPYALAGAGYHTNGVNQATFHIGAGLDYRISANCMGIFTDVRYTFAEDTGDYTVVRAGVRMNF
jgi:outer membrane protein W